MKELLLLETCHTTQRDPSNDIARTAGRLKGKTRRRL